MPSTYNNAGIRFAYPDNWELTDAATDGDDQQTLAELTVRSPNTAFWSLTVYSGERPTRPILDEVLHAMQAEYPDLEHEPADAPLTQPILPELCGVEIHFVCLDFTNTALVHVYHQDGNTHLLLRQAEDHEWDAVEPVLRAVTISLLSDETPLD